MRFLILLILLFMTANTLQAQLGNENNYPKAVVSVNIQSTLSLKESFEYMVPMDLEHIFNMSYKMIPQIDSTSNEAAWFTPGMSRVIYFNDGSTSQEELLSVRPSSGFT